MFRVERLFKSKRLVHDKSVCVSDASGWIVDGQKCVNLWFLGQKSDWLKYGIFSNNEFLS